MCARMRGIHADVIRGSIGGNTFTANQFHQIIIRQRTSPVNPNTTNQALIRGAMSTASVAYNNLSEGDKQRWQDYADSIHYSNPLGPISVPGRQVCIGNFTTAEYLADRGIPVGAASADPPLVGGFIGISDFEVAPLLQAGTGFALGFLTFETFDVTGFVFRSFAFSSSRFRFKGPFLSSTLDSAEIAGPGATIINFTGLQEDSVYFVKIRALTSDPPFRLSAAHIIRATATVTP